MYMYNDMIGQGSFVSGREWTKYAELVTDDGTLRRGDIVVWQDPDAGSHASECELVHMAEYVAFVEEIWDIEGQEEPELSISAPLGRVDMSDLDGIAGKDIYKGMTEPVDMFLNSEYDRYMLTEAHLGKHGVSEKVWNSYSVHDNSGPYCDVCTGDRGTDGRIVSGE